MNIKNINFLKKILTHLNSGNVNSMSLTDSLFMNNIMDEILNTDIHTEQQIYAMKLMLNISNILYNNSTVSMLPLEDGIYDMLINIYKRYDKNFLVGAPPVSFHEVTQLENIGASATPLFSKLSNEYIDNNLFGSNILRSPAINIHDISRTQVIEDAPTTTKRLKNTTQEYPDLVGTLDKCKYALNAQANDNGVLDNDNVQIFERDFLGKHLEMGLFHPYDTITMILELKYDGVSVEATVSDQVYNAGSRGDTGQGLSSDLTPIFQGYKFNHAQNVDPNSKFGMKFEAVITYDNLYRLSLERERSYANCRQAVNGIIGANDGAKYRDFITLVPLATSLGLDRITEIEFMNKYYHSGELLRYAVIQGNYTQILFQVKKFVEEAEALRPLIPVMYDGVVVSYYDQRIIDILGRENSINKYSIAIKFNTMIKQTIFLGYKFTVGQNGVITPLMFFKPVEFIGGIHEKASAHSYSRFMSLQLREGDILNVEFVNDVMPYCTKADVVENLSNPNPIIPFPDRCQCCGSTLLIATSDKEGNRFCMNLACRERSLARMVNMVKKLNIKNFSDESLRALNVTSFTEFMNLTIDVAKRALGDANAYKLLDAINKLKTDSIYDHKFVGALGFSNIASQKWKAILPRISIYDLCRISDRELRTRICSIKGLGESCCDAICAERQFFKQDLMLLLSMPNVIHSIGSPDVRRVSIRFTGFRNEAMVNELTELGYDINTDGSVTKNTDILLVPYKGFTSVKVDKAIRFNMIILTSDELMDEIRNGTITSEYEFSRFRN